ncbi:MAG: DcrB-related protein [Candidatus Bathyarchaeia archaeon]
MKKLVGILAALLIFTFVNTVQAYTNNKYGFSIEPPSGWSVIEPSWATVAVIGPTEHGFTVNVNIQVETTSMSLNEYISASRQQLQNLEDFYEISEGSRTINNVNAYEIVYTWTYSGITVQQKQVWLVKGGKAFVITYSAAPATYSKYLPAFESSLQTFKIEAGIEWWVWLIIIVVVVGVVAAVATLILRRRKAQPAPTTLVQQPPQAPPPPT